MLSRNGIQYIDHNVETDPAAVEELARLGLKTLPVTIIGDQVIVGYEPNKILAALHREPWQEVRHPSITIPLILKAGEAAERAIRQMPDKQLDWSIPERKRTMREFAHHILSHIKTAMVSQSVRGWESSPRDYAVFSSFQQIADYGRPIIAQFQEWAAKQDYNVLCKAPAEGQTGKSQAEQLDVSAGAIIQHLRQLYFILEHFGIQPEQRIPDSEWPAQYVLSILW